MVSESMKYICPTCFEVSKTQDEHHEHLMVVCDAGELGDEVRKPVTDGKGRLLTRAPRWFYEAVGLLKKTQH